MGVHSFRLNDEEEAAAKRLGLKPSKVAKEAVLAELDVQEQLAALERLRRLRRAHDGPSAVDIIRELREGR